MQQKSLLRILSDTFRLSTAVVLHSLRKARQTTKMNWRRFISQLFLQTPGVKGKGCTTLMHSDTSYLFALLIQSICRCADQTSRDPRTQNSNSAGIAGLPGTSPKAHMSTSNFQKTFSVVQTHRMCIEVNRAESNLFC